MSPVFGLILWIIYHLKTVRTCDLSAIVDATVTFVSLQNCGLTSIDEDQLARFTQLETLDLQGNELTVFPNLSMVGSTLKDLELKLNYFGDFDSALVQPLKKLERLGLRSTELDLFPDLQPIASTSKFLSINTNYITSFSADQLMALYNLQELDFSENWLTSFPHFPSGLPRQLASLSLWNNGLTVLPPLAVGNITNFHLNIVANPLNLCNCANAWLKKADTVFSLSYWSVECGGVQWSALNFSQFLLLCDPQPSAFESGFATKMATNMAVSNFNNYLLHSVFRETSLVKCFGQCEQIAGCVLFFWHPIERDCVVIAPTDDPVSVPDGSSQVWSYYAVN